MGGGSLALYLVLWLAVCSFQTALLEVDASAIEACQALASQKEKPTVRAHPVIP